MTDKNNGENPTANTRQQPLAQTPSAKLTAQEKVLSEEPASSAKDNQDIVEEMRDEWKTVEKWTLGISIITLAVLIVGAFIYGGQLQQMATQSELLAVQLGASAVESRSSADRVQEQLKIAQQGVVLASTQMKIDQRAWIKISLSDVNVNPNGTIYYTISVADTGKTPALRVQGWLTSRVGFTGDVRPDFVYKSGHPRNHLQEDVIFAGAEDKQVIPVIIHGENKHPIPLIASAPLAKALGTPMARMYISGRFTYDDIFGVHHWLQFCGADTQMEMRKDPVRKSCSNYNRMDKNPD